MVENKPLTNLLSDEFVLPQLVHSSMHLTADEANPLIGKLRLFAVQP